LDLLDLKGVFNLKTLGFSDYFSISGV